MTAPHDRPAPLPERLRVIGVELYAILPPPPGVLMEEEGVATCYTVEEAAELALRYNAYPALVAANRKMREALAETRALLQMHWSNNPNWAEQNPQTYMAKIDALARSALDDAGGAA